MGFVGDIPSSAAYCEMQIWPEVTTAPTVIEGSIRIGSPA
jgi:hypothetical protein